MTEKNNLQEMFDKMNIDYKKCSSDLNEIQSKLDNMNDENKRLIEENKKHSLKIDELKREVELNKSTKSTNTIIMDLNAQISSKEKEISNLNTEKLNIQKKLDEVIRDMEKLKISSDESYNKLKSQYDSLNNKKNNIDNNSIKELNELKKQCDENEKAFNTKIIGLEKTIIENKKTIEKLKNSSNVNTEYKKTIDKLTNDISVLQKDIKDKINNYEKKLNENEKNINKLKNDLSNKSANDEKTKIMQNTIDKLKKENDKIKELIKLNENLNKRISEKESENLKMKNEMNSNINVIKDLKNQMASKEREYVDKLKKAQSGKVDEKEVNNLKQKHNEDIKKLNAIIDSLTKKDTNAINTKINELNNENKKLKDSQESIKQNFKKDMDNAIRNKDNIIKERDNKISKIENELKICNNNLINIKNNSIKDNVLKKEFDELKIKNNKNEIEIQNLNKKINDLIGKSTKNENEITKKYSDKIKNLESKIIEKDKKISELSLGSGSIQDKDKKIKKLEDDIKSLNDKISKCESDGLKKIAENKKQCDKSLQVINSTLLNLKTEKELLTKKNIECEKKLKAYGSENTKINDLENQIKKLTLSEKNSLIELEKIKNELKKCKDENKKGFSDKSQIENLNKVIKANEIKINEQNLKIKKLEDEIKIKSGSESSEVKKIRSDLINIQNELKICDKSKKDLEIKIKEYEKNNKNFNQESLQKINKLENDIKNLKIEYESCKKDLNNFKSKGATDSDAYKKLQTNLTNIQNELKKCNKDKNDLEKGGNNANQESLKKITKLEKEIKDIRVEYDNCKKLRDMIKGEKDKEVAELNKIISDLRDKNKGNNSLSEQLNLKNIENAKLQNEIQLLKLNLNECRKSRDSIKNMYNMLKMSVTPELIKSRLLDVLENIILDYIKKREIISSNNNLTSNENIAIFKVFENILKEIDLLSLSKTPDNNIIKIEQFYNSIGNLISNNKNISKSSFMNSIKFDAKKFINDIKINKNTSLDLDKLYNSLGEYVGRKSEMMKRKNDNDKIKLLTKSDIDKKYKNIKTIEEIIRNRDEVVNKLLKAYEDENAIINAVSEIKYLIDINNYENKKLYDQIVKQRNDDLINHTKQISEINANRIKSDKNTIDDMEGRLKAVIDFISKKDNKTFIMSGNAEIKKLMTDDQATNFELMRFADTIYTGIRSGLVDNSNLEKEITKNITNLKVKDKVIQIFKILEKNFKNDVKNCTGETIEIQKQLDSIKSLYEIAIKQNKQMKADLDSKITRYEERIKILNDIVSKGKGGGNSGRNDEEIKQCQNELIECRKKLSRYIKKTDDTKTDEPTLTISEIEIQMNNLKNILAKSGLRLSMEELINKTNYLIGIASGKTQSHASEDIKRNMIKYYKDGKYNACIDSFKNVINNLSDYDIDRIANTDEAKNAFVNKTKNVADNIIFILSEFEKIMIAKVFINLKPSNNLKKKFIEYVKKDGLDQSTSLNYIDKDDRSTIYNCSGIFNGPKSIYERLTSMIQKNKSNVVICAYGQSGSGKTYTMLGDNINSSDSLLNKITDYICNDSTTETVDICSIQFYNNKSYVTMHGKQATQPLKVDSNRIVVPKSINDETPFVFGTQFDSNKLASSILCSKALDKDLDIYASLKSPTKKFNIKTLNDERSFIEMRRPVRNMLGVNSVSSRSHLMIILRIKYMLNKSDPETKRTRFIAFIDLCGNEKIYSEVKDETGDVKVKSKLTIDEGIFVQKSLINIITTFKGYSSCSKWEKATTIMSDEHTNLEKPVFSMTGQEDGLIKILKLLLCRYKIRGVDEVRYAQLLGIFCMYQGYEPNDNKIVLTTTVKDLKYSTTLGTLKSIKEIMDVVLKKR